jgi:23S rRNA (cytosine1962-C5)-methyltransferase
VLDAYCHVGGFGLQAARAGASHVVQVDSSNVAIDGARAAAELNGLADRTEALMADAIVYLKEAQAAGKTFDRIVVDPPKFAQGRSHLEDALQKYARLNTLAMATLSEGGLLLTNSCSRHVGEDEFGRMLTESGHRLRKSVRVLERWGQPADHPTLSVAPEGRYLKTWLVSLGD